MSETEHLTRNGYEKELLHLQTELVYMQEWLIAEGRRLVVLFEGRDTAGKDGAIKRIVTSSGRRTASPTPGGSRPGTRSLAGSRARSRSARCRATASATSSATRS
jgi:hypothetical protein